MAKEIFIYGAIGVDWWTGEGNTAKDIISQLAAIPENEDVHIRINSPGGDVIEGIAMYNAIATHKGKTVTIDDGMCASMGFILLQAGDIRKGYKNSTGLAHNSSGLSWGNARDLRTTADLLDALDNGLIESIAQKSNLTAEQVKAKWFDYTDHSMTAQQMLDEGLIDEIINLTVKGVPDNVAAMSQQEMFAAYAKLQKPSEKKGFMALLSEIKALVTGNSSKPTQDKLITEEDMIKIPAGHKAVAAALGLTFAEGETEKEVTLTPEQISAIEAKLTADAQAIADAKAAKEAAEACLATAQAEIATMKAAAGANQVNPRIKDENVGKVKTGINPDAAHNKEAAAINNF